VIGQDPSDGTRWDEEVYPGSAHVIILQKIINRLKI